MNYKLIGGRARGKRGIPIDVQIELYKRVIIDQEPVAEVVEELWNRVDRVVPKGFANSFSRIKRYLIEEVEKGNEKIISKLLEANLLEKEEETNEDQVEEVPTQEKQNKGPSPLDRVQNEDVKSATISNTKKLLRK